MASVFRRRLLSFCEFITWGFPFSGFGCGCFGLRSLNGFRASGFGQFRGCGLGSMFEVGITTHITL